MIKPLLTLRFPATLRFSALFASFFTFLTPSPSAWAASAPFGTGSQTHFRVMAEKGAFTGLLDAALSVDTDNRSPKTLTTGLYTRLFPGFRTGLFYRRAIGLRHDEDWNVNPTRSKWNDTSQRGEDFLILDLTSKIPLEFLPGRQWVGELKTRFHAHFLDQHQTLTVRPGLSYFILNGEEPLLNFYSQCELYFPLNYGFASVYETWTYLGALTSITRGLQVGGALAYHTQLWYTPDQSNIGNFNSALFSTDQSLIFGLNFILKI